MQAVALTVLVTAAGAQPAPNTRPTGGQVAAGTATIGGNATSTLISQSSQNAVINWQSYNLGSAQTIQYQQPGASSFTLNRVLSSNPSQIAGHIIANGRIAIVNQSGVVFLQGSTVDTAGLVVSASGITNQDFMAGRLVFSAPANPGAMVSNAGNITIRQAGLAALVAPQVANSGVITAVLGTVVLGAATTHTLDTYGDGLVTLNVTGQVTSVQIGNQTVPALVTNIGTILAPGGTVVLTAKAADGLVKTLINAGGTISTSSQSGQAGRVLVDGVGGDIEIDGNVGATSASGTGGSITVSGNHNVTIGAAGVLDASGAAGGGVISVAAAGNATLAAGGALRANATTHGAGGHVGVHAGGLAAIHGTVSAAGAVATDAGGIVEISGERLLVDGGLKTAAPGGRPGQVIYTATGSLTIASSCATMTNCLTFANFLNDGSVVDDADGAILLSPGASSASQTLTSLAGISLTTTPGENASGNIIFESGLSVFAPSFTINAAGGLYIDGVIGGGAGVAATSVQLSAGGAISEHAPGGNGDANGTIDASLLVINNAGSVVLDGGSNDVGTLGGAASTGSFTLTDAAGLTVTAPVSAGGNVNITITGAGNSLDTSAIISGQDIALTAAGSLALGAALEASGFGVALVAQGGDVTSSSGITASVLAAQASGAVSLSGAANAIASIGTALGLTGVTAGQGVLIDDGAGQSLLVDANVSGSAVALSAGAALTIGAGVTVMAAGPLSLSADGNLTIAGELLTGSVRNGVNPTGLLALSASGGNVIETGGTIEAGTLTVQASEAGGAGGEVTLNGSNTILALGASSAGGAFSLTDEAALTVVGGAAVSGTAGVTLDLGGFNLTQDGGSAITASAGIVSVTALGFSQDGASLAGMDGVVLTLGGDLAQTGGSAIGSGGTVLITARNVTQDMSAITGNGGVSLMVSGDLAQTATGTIASNGGTVSLASNGGTLYLGGLVSATDATVDLTAALGDITQTARTGGSVSGTLLAGTLSAQAGTAGGEAFRVVLDDATANAIGTVTSVTASGSIVIGDSAGLTLAAQGAVTSGAGGLVSIEAASLTLLTGAVIGAAGNFVAAGNVTESQDARILAAGNATVGGALSQTGATLTAGGAIVLGSNTPDGTASVIAAQSGGSLVDAMGALTILGGVTQDGSTLAAGSMATIYAGLTQNAGSSLSGAAVIIGRNGLGGTLSQQSSTLTALGGNIGVTESGGITQDSASLIRAGSGDVSLDSTAGSLTLAGQVATEGGGTLTLVADGGISETAAGSSIATGTLSAGTLAGRAGLDAALTTASGSAAGNQIATLGDFVAGGMFALVDGAALTVDGALSAASVALRVPTLDVAPGGAIGVGKGGTVSIGADRYTIDGTITAPAGLVALGLLHAGSFSVAAGGTIDPASLLAIGAGAAGTIALGTTNGMSANGSNGSGGDWGITTAGSVTLLDVTGAIDLTGAAGTLGLFSSGAVQVNTGAPADGLSVDALYGEAGGNFLAPSLANGIGSVAAAGLATGGSLVLGDGVSLMLDGGAALRGDAGVTLTVTGGTITQGASGTIVSGGAVVLDAVLLTQDEGASVSAQTGFSATGAVTQDGQDSIGTATGNYQSGAVDQMGGSMISAASGNAFISGNAVQDGGTISAAQGAVSVTGTLEQQAGTLTAGLGGVSIGVAAMPSPGILLVQDPGALLQAAGTVTVYGAAVQNGAMLTAGGALDIYGSVAQSNGSTMSAHGVTIGSAGLAGTLSQAGSVIDADGFSLAVTLSGALTQDAASSLTTEGGSVVLDSTGGGLMLGGTVSAGPGSVSLATPMGMITQAASGADAVTGLLVAGSLAASAGGPGGDAESILLDAGANRIGTMTMVSATGSAVIGDATALTLSGTITGNGGVTLALPGLDLTEGSASLIDSSGGAVFIEAAMLTQEPAASITAYAGFALSGSLVQAQGDTITALNGTLSIAGDAAQSGASVIMAGNGSLSVGGSLTQTGSRAAASGDLTVDGAVTQTGGSVQAGQDILIGMSEDGTAGLLLSQAGGASLTAGRDVVVDGSVTQTDASVTAAGTVTLFGGLTQEAASEIGAGAVVIGAGSQAGTITQDQSLILATAGNVTISLDGALIQSATGTITSRAGGIAIDSTGGTLFLGGTISALAGVADLTALAGDITETALGGGAPTGRILALALAARAAGATGNVVLDTPGGNAVGTLTGTGGGTALGAAGQFMLTDEEALALAAGVTLTGGAGVGITLPAADSLTQGAGSVIESAAGRVAIQAAALIQAMGATLTGNAGVSVSGAVQQQGDDGVSTASGAIVIGGDVAQNASGIAAPSGAVTIGGSLSQAASTLSAGDAVTVDGSLAQSNGAALTGSMVTIGVDGLGGTLSQAASALTATDGNVTITLAGDFSQDAASTLISKMGGISIATSGGGIAFGGLISAVSGQTSLIAPQGAVTEAFGGGSAAGTLLTSFLTAQAGSGAAVFDLTLNGQGVNRIGTITAATATGTLDVNDASSLVVAAGGSVAGAAGVTLVVDDGLSEGAGGTIGSSGGNVAIEALAGNLDFAGRIVSVPLPGVQMPDSAFGGTIALLAPQGSIDAASGVLDTGTLAAQAGGSVTLSGSANQIGVIGPAMLPGGALLAGITAGGTIALADSAALTVEQAALDGGQGVYLSLASDLTEAATGTIASATGAIAIESPATLEFAGSLAAPQILLGYQTAPKHIIWNGGTIETGSAIPAPPPGGSPDIADPIGPNSPLYARGLFAMAASFTQTGRTVVSGLHGAARETMQLTLIGPGGVIAFDPRTMGGYGLVAPGTQLLLDVQTAGVASGNIDVAGLNLYYYGIATGGGGASLTGTVDGRTGTSAASSGFIHSLPGVQYEDNGCAIESLNCVLLSPVVVPPGDPVQGFQETVQRRKDDDDDLILPNVGERDY